MNKLDFRDFLFHGYGVRAFNVRTFIKQRPVEVAYSFPLLKGKSSKPQWHRRRAIKFMTIEMDEPFVWPEMPHEEQLNAEYVRRRCRVLEALPLLTIATVDSARIISWRPQNNRKTKRRIKTRMSPGEKAAMECPP
jgi:hypothetical protein